MNRSRRLVAFFVSVLLAVLPFVVWTERQAIYDWWRLRGYNPPAGIVELADATTMNQRSRRLFYVYRPQLDDKVAFNQHCQGHEESIILGCYIANHGIFLYNVQDPRLSGIHEVTAAHELLHAAYDRLSSKERKRIDDLLTQFYDQLADERIKSVVASYRAKDPSIVPNELHSIIGTEVRTIPAELETYYQRYFTDRLKIVGFSEQYEQAFTERKQKVAEYDKRLEALKVAIEAAERQLTNLTVSLEAERRNMDALLANNQIEAYNARVPGFNAQVRHYNNLASITRQQIDEYNRLVGERNDVALEEQTLHKALDSRITPQTEE